MNKVFFLAALVFSLTACGVATSEKEQEKIISSNPDTVVVAEDRSEYWAKVLQSYLN